MHMIDWFFDRLIGTDWPDVFVRASKTFLQTAIPLVIAALGGYIPFGLAIIASAAAAGLSVIQNALSRDPATHIIV